MQSKKYSTNYSLEGKYCVHCIVFMCFIVFIQISFHSCKISFYLKTNKKIPAQCTSAGLHGYQETRSLHSPLSPDRPELPSAALADTWAVAVSVGYAGSGSEKTHILSISCRESINKIFGNITVYLFCMGSRRSAFAFCKQLNIECDMG